LDRFLDGVIWIVLLSMTTTWPGDLSREPQSPSNQRMEIPKMANSFKMWADAKKDFSKPLGKIVPSQQFIDARDSDGLIEKISKEFDKSIDKVTSSSYSIEKSSEVLNKSVSDFDAERAKYFKSLNVANKKEDNAPFTARIKEFEKSADQMIQYLSDEMGKALNNVKVTLKDTYGKLAEDVASAPLCANAAIAWVAKAKELTLDPLEAKDLKLPDAADAQKNFMAAIKQYKSSSDDFKKLFNVKYKRDEIINVGRGAAIEIHGAIKHAIDCVHELVAAIDRNWKNLNGSTYFDGGNELSKGINKAIGDMKAEQDRLVALCKHFR
jgi:hypothetical protein